MNKLCVMASLALGVSTFTITTSQAVESPASSVEELKRQMDILSNEVQKLKMGEAGAGVRADHSQYGFGPAASKVYRIEHGVSLGGYGEFLYQHFANSKHDGTTSGISDQITMMRAVLYTGYKFDENWLLNTELEVENGTTENNKGSVSIEFAYLDRLISPAFNARLGLLLLPMGLINELHEPTVYLGTQRPDVETVLIPATWADDGFGFFGDLGQVSYKQYFVAGLDASGFTDAGIREGRTGGAKTDASHWASVTRLDYTGIAGLLTGVSAYIGNASAEKPAAKGGGMKVPIGIYDFHVDWHHRGLQLRTVGVYSTLGKIGDLNNGRNLVGSQSVGDSQRGIYFEGGYDVLAGGTSTQALIPFLRWEYYDTQASVPQGFVRNDANLVRLLTAGVNYKPIDQIVLKADFRDYFLGDGTGVNQIGVAAGYVF